MQGQLLKSGVSDTFTIKTTPLPAGKFKYTMLLKDTADPTKTKVAIVTGIVAGGNLTVDMRGNQEVASI